MHYQIRISTISLTLVFWRCEVFAFWVVFCQIDTKGLDAWKHAAFLAGKLVPEKKKIAGKVMTSCNSNWFTVKTGLFAIAKKHFCLPSWFHTIYHIPDYTLTSGQHPGPSARFHVVFPTDSIFKILVANQGALGDMYI